MKSERNRRRTVTVLLAILILLMLLFIWGNSILPASVSSKISAFAARLLGKASAETQTQVRKAGHFTEFFVLGGAMGLFVPLQGKMGKELAMLLALPGLFVPLMDETIQMFNDRGPQVLDIWIDIAGYTCGCLLILLAVALVRFFRRNRTERDK